jgi:glucuronate isomerase
VFGEVFGLDELLSEANADQYFDHINDHLGRAEFRPRALFDRFNIEVLATTESPLDSLEHHQAIRDSDWSGRVITTYRPDSVTDPEFENFAANVERFGQIAGEDVTTYAGYLAAHRAQRAVFQSMGATATDHGHPTAATADLDHAACEALYRKALDGNCTAEESELFRAQMLTEMAKMSLDDGMVMQLHPGSFRNHNPLVFERFGRDKGADIPQRTEYVNALKPLLDRCGNEPGFTLILFTLDETNYSRELAPLAGHYPCLRLGPPWWFHDSAQGMLRFRQQTTETAGFYNTVGFNDDTRAFLSIPARHDVARRVDCAYLATLVAEHQIGETEAEKIARDLAYDLVKQAYRL